MATRFKRPIHQLRLVLERERSRADYALHDWLMGRSYRLWKRIYDR